MYSEFEEKDFEAPLYSELKFGSFGIATPGQVFENKFGIDAALMAQNPLIWDLLGFCNIPEGVILNDLRWGFVWRKLRKKRILPTFNTNLLVQAKRPEVLKRVPRKLKDFGFRSKYWRFSTVQHQQELLEKVSRKLRKRALVIYSAPAFNTFEDLYNFTENQTIVENSTFIKVERLSNHSKWCYDRAGTSGIAHSKPEFIEDEPFHRMLKQLKSHNEHLNFSKELNILQEVAISVCNETANNSIASYYLKLYRKLKRLERIFEFDDIFENNELFNFIAFNMFCNVLKIKWYIV